MVSVPFGTTNERGYPYPTFARLLINLEHFCVINKYDIR